MTSTPEPLGDKVDRLETALGRLAELSFNNAERHDRAIDRMEAAITNLANVVANSNIRIEQNNSRIEQNNTRIEQILEYLRDRNGGSSPL
ncbi:hypothetical protein G7B40_031230 [Aetokthonos hydrillicola Thurmond2011]|jgi:uncharacterized protein YukE|uniref:Uncharacterized protein n=1 Tax=Aetokthonos hydrillicola Thurmond2011 TaxID=2712845 RepID=A0AAP5MD10_9CYAN|nr:hypothetical protein [Aetokthonos hydrillicola]MBO3463216.1 hypothetical protein [Aetokthonos hydrillicola CCALA 1050]MBW4590528.1 hypothetical protein [Aetokthonos hydrillicola CCALA 1050]MDR9898998.1 hypothetical protein [Aetokthonos hydrillicola Thurmond2011]